jgi:transketolase
MRSDDVPALTFVPPEVFESTWRSAKGTPEERAAAFADLARINTLSMVMQAGSGHLGSSFSALDVVSWIYLTRLDVYGDVDGEQPAGTFFSSKGHDAPGVYAVLTATRRLDPDLVHRLRRLDGLPGHPDVRLPWVEANTGSLGMGISKAKGMIEAQRIRERRTPVYVMTGDGELQEGQNWEALQGAANRGLSELTVVVDHNKIQSDTWVRRVSDLGDLEAKLAAFGWAVARCDGHDLAAVAEAFATLEADPRPGVLIADTEKGHGVSFMADFPPDGDFYPFHSGAPSDGDYGRALTELTERASTRTSDLGVELSTTTVEVPARAPVHGGKLVDAWGAALVARAERDETVVALDGDLLLDTGLTEFSRRFPDRFLECGIAEQDMVSQAGGLALRGLQPVVHSFASFLSGRPHEQVLTNSTEGTRIVYVGSLAGIVPGGPGHSHQAVTDVASFAVVHGLVVVEPGHPDEVAPILDLLLDEHPGSSYVRLTTPPVELGFDWPTAPPRIGVGTVLRPGSDVTLVGSGPIVLRETWAAAALLSEAGVSAGVVAMPWSNVVDATWWAEVLGATQHLVVVDNHVAAGGLGAHLLRHTALAAWGGTAEHIAVDGVPACGTNDEVLRHHGLDAASIAAAVLGSRGAR